MSPWIAALTASLPGWPGAAQAPVPLTHLHLLPTASVPLPWQAAVELGQTTTFGGARAEGGGGTGNQTYHGWIAAGLPGRVALLGFLQGNDDPTWAPLDGVRYRQETFAVGGGVRAVLRDGGSWTLAAQGTLERLELKSDPGLFTREPGLGRTLHRAATASLLAGLPAPGGWRLTLAPGVLILPGEANGLPYYGWTGILGLGADGSVGDAWRVFASAEFTLGPGANSLTGVQTFRRVPVASAGVVYDADPRTRVTVFLTNSAGGSPATRHLTHAGHAPLQWGARVRFSPTAAERPGDEKGSAPGSPASVGTRYGGAGNTGAPPGPDGGLARPAPVSLAGTSSLPAWRAELRASADRSGGQSARLRVGLSRISELELGVVRAPGLDAGPALGIRLGSALHYRLGGRLVLRESRRDQGLEVAARVSVGRDTGTLQGYLVAELPFSFALPHRARLVLAPLYLQTGGASPLALGAAAMLLGPGRTQLVLEPTLRTDGGPHPWTVAVRSPPWQGARAEIFASTARSGMGAGRFLTTAAPRWGVAVTIGPR